MQRFCEDCGHQAKPGDILCNECGGTLVEHELDVPEVPAYNGQGAAADDFDLESLLGEVKPGTVETPAAGVPPQAVFETEEPTAPEAINLDDLLGTAPGQPPAQPAAAAPTLDLDDILGGPAPPSQPTAPVPSDLDLEDMMGGARRQPATPAAPPAGEGLDLEALLDTPASPPPAGSEDIDLDSLLSAPAVTPAAPSNADLGELDELLGISSAPAAAKPPLGYIDVDISGAVTRHALEGEVVTIGRIDPGRYKPTIDLSRDDAVSRRHAEIRIREGECILVDTGSTNGSRLNGTACEPHREYKLSDGDKISLGEKCVLTIHL